MVPAAAQLLGISTPCRDAHPIPQQALRHIKAEKGFSPDERAWCIAGLVSLLTGVVVSYGLSSPMPLLMAFGFCAVVAIRLEDEEF